MTNPRAGLAAHLEGVMNGIFLVVGAWRICSATLTNSSIG